jgi:hypothetical protein
MEDFVIKKLGFMVLVITTASSAVATGLATEMQDGSGRAYQPFAAMQGCDDIAPNGYFLTELRYVNSPTPCFGKWIYIFESYFDKPSGYQIIICSPTLPWSVPNNWYRVRDVSSSKCIRRLGETSGSAWLIQKG